jgi:hypothetical protein
MKYSVKTCLQLLVFGAVGDSPAKGKTKEQHLEAARFFFHQADIDEALTHIHDGMGVIEPIYDNVAGSVKEAMR